MCNRRPERAFALCTLDVDKNPLTVGGAFRELVNPCLIHEEPTRYSEFASDPVLDVCDGKLNWLILDLPWGQNLTLDAHA
jgi:hypothetical protein